MNTPRFEEPPYTWPGNENVFPLGDEQYADWEVARDTGRRIGLHTWHWDQDKQQWCGGWLGFTNVEGHLERSKHQLVSEDPLTVSPSLLCPHCGNHGFIRDGRWVSA